MVSPPTHSTASMAATSASENLPFPPFPPVPPLRARMAARSLSSFSLVMTHLDGWTGTLAWEPLTFSRVRPLTWMTHFRR